MSTSKMMADLMSLPQWTARTARLMIGIPDYETYVTHRKATHPDLPVMTYEEFFRDRQDARYGAGKRSGRMFRCC